MFTLDSIATVHWQGSDSTTPPGHILVQGIDRLGNHRVWLFRGDSTSVEGYCGNMIVRKDARPSIYNHRGTWAGAGFGEDSLAIFTRLAETAARDRA